MAKGKSDLMGLGFLFGVTEMVAEFNILKTIELNTFKTVNYVLCELSIQLFYDKKEITFSLKYND